MEIKYPILIFIITGFMSWYLLFQKNKKEKFSTGSKIANTNYIKNTTYYQKQIKKYHLLKKIIQGTCLISIITTTLLLARLTQIKTIDQNQYNRDIFLCMDVSASVDDLNLELVKSLKTTVESLNGERFGISIFNSSSVTLVPLTDDYEYVLNILNKIQKSIEINNTYGSYTKDNYFYTSNYIISGTQEGADIKGSSLIGDGLASCIYSFPNLDEERTRIIILSTDNDLAGTPYVTLNQGVEISANKNIVVYGIGTKEMSPKNREEFQQAVLKTGGKYYDHSTNLVKNIINDIEKTSKSLRKQQMKKQEIDIPQIPFILLLSSITILILLKQKVKK